MQLNAQLGSVMLSDLRKQYPEIPYHGVLAGGAVADWFFGLKPNDLDVFVPVVENYNKCAFTAQIGVLAHDIDPYQNISCISWKGLYKVVSIERNGMLNIISCEGNDISVSKIISGFDLNACRVGIDLKTEKLVWDESFALFLKNKQLKVAALFTPVHTAIRFFLKKERLSVLADVEVEMKILAEAWKNDRLGLSLYSLPFLFGKPYLDKALKANELGLGKFFKIDAVDNLWTLSPKISTSFDTTHLDHIMFPVHAPQSLRSQCTRISESYREKIELVSKATSNPVVLKMIQMFSGSYVRGKVSERSVKIVAAFLTRRFSLYPLFLGLHLERQLQVIRRFIRFARRHGSWIYGLAQCEATALDILSDDSFLDLIKRFEAKYSKPAISVLENVPKRFLWYDFKQITTPKELYTACESFRLSTINCDNIFSQGSRLVLIQSRISKHDKSLAEFGFSHHFDIKILTHKTFANKKLPVCAQIASMWFLSRINSCSVLEHVKEFFAICKTVGLNTLTAKFFDSFSRKCTVPSAALR